MRHEKSLASQLGIIRGDALEELSVQATVLYRNQKRQSYACSGDHYLGCAAAALTNFWP